jgi:hypothetical protein
MSWAETQQPETTLASQSLQKTGFRSASQMEFEFVLIGGIDLGQVQELQELQKFRSCRI